MSKATRPAFICINNNLYEKNYTFDFYSGFSVEQKQKTINAFHKEIYKSGIKNVLEISRKNDNEIGIRLSAFNLQILLNEHKYPVECIYQSSKVFGDKQFLECLNMQPGDAKRFVKECVESEQLSLTKFSLLGIDFPLEPKTLFYDYLYIVALSQNFELSTEILKYDCFTDIEFNPKKQFASQARSCAIFKYLHNHNLIEEYLEDIEKFKTIYTIIDAKNMKQLSLELK